MKRRLVAVSLVLALGLSGCAFCVDTEASYIIRVIVINLLVHLLTCYLNLLSVNNDYIITCVNVWCKLRFVLSS